MPREGKAPKKAEQGLPCPCPSFTELGKDGTALLSVSDVHRGAELRAREAKP